MDRLPAQKILIIRFSSLGDIFQCLFSADALRSCFPQSQIHWLVRSDFADNLLPHPDLDEVISFDRQWGWWGLILLAFQLRARGYTHLYDAHNNLRSHLVSWILRARFKDRPHFKRRSKNRIRRLLFFKWRVPVLPHPFRGALSFLKPLRSWGVSQIPVAPPQWKWPPDLIRRVSEIERLNETWCLGPSAAWELKRWPPAHWKEWIQRYPKTRFILLGGPGDEFCQELAALDRQRILNLAGRLSWQESTCIIAHSRGLVAGDTGVFHIADYFGKTSVGLIGPSAFGYPSRISSTVAELKLDCKPCSKDGRGACRNPIYQRCLSQLTPAMVHLEQAK